MTNHPTQLHANLVLSIRGVISGGGRTPLFAFSCYDLDLGHDFDHDHDFDLELTRLCFYQARRVGYRDVKRSTAATPAWAQDDADI